MCFFARTRDAFCPRKDGLPRPPLLRQDPIISHNVFQLQSSWKEIMIPNLSALDIVRNRETEPDETKDILVVSQPRYAPRVWMKVSLAALEQQHIEELSYVPVETQEIYKKAQDAENAMKAGETESLLLSRLAKESYAVNPAKLIGVDDQERVTPAKTMLVELGLKAKIVSKSKYLAIINDRDIPLMATSMGPNGVLAQFPQEYGGEDRINLFYKDDASTMKLLIDYLMFRNANRPTIFAAFVEKLEEHQKAGYKIRLDNDNILEESEQKKYDHIVIFFSRLLEAMKAIGEKKKSPADLNDIGIGMISFCQTWMKDCKPDNAAFTVMSPHFQTRLYVKDVKLVMHALRYVQKVNDPEAEELLENYRVVMGELLGRMKKEGYKKAFVHLDKLAGVMLKKYRPLKLV